MNILKSAIDVDNPEAKPLGIILFSDESKVSSFGTQQAYPVIARIANLARDPNAERV